MYLPISADPDRYGLPELPFLTWEDKGNTRIERMRERWRSMGEARKKIKKKLKY